MSNGRASVRDGGQIADVDELSRRYRAVLLRYFMRRGIAPLDAQDLTQEVFVRLSRRDVLDRVASVEGFLFTIAANVAIDFVRRSKVRSDCPTSGVYDSVNVSEEFSPDRLLEGRQELGRIVAALNEMPERMRNIFILARLENLPRSEIAQRLGVSKSLVEQQIAQAAACLAERRRRWS
jgi:RNA polymerase sigma-70 factor (ECF subfamily)